MSIDENKIKALQMYFREYENEEMTEEDCENLIDDFI